MELRDRLVLLWEAFDELFTEKLPDRWVLGSSSDGVASLFVYAIVRFLLTAMSVTLPIPCGVFTPVFGVGAAFGRLWGELMDDMFPELSVVRGGYAVVGAAALASGVTRTISTAVIVFELTGQLHHMLPILVAVMLSMGVGQILNHSFYDHYLLQKGLPFISLPQFSALVSQRKTAAQIATQRGGVPPFLTLTSTHLDASRALDATDGFSVPLVDTAESMTLIGAVQRSVIVRAL